MFVLASVGTHSTVTLVFLYNIPPSWCESTSLSIFRSLSIAPSRSLSLLPPVYLCDMHHIYWNNWGILWQLPLSDEWKYRMDSVYYFSRSAIALALSMLLFYQMVYNIVIDHSNSNENQLNRTNSRLTEKKKFDIDYSRWNQFVVNFGCSGL